MHALAFIWVALALTAHAVPIIHPKSNSSLERRGAEYEIVNVGGEPSPTVPIAIESVTEPSAPQQTVTVYVPEISSPTSTPYSSSSIPPVQTGSPHGLDRIAKMLGKSLEQSNSTNSHLRSRGNDTTATTSRFRARGNLMSHLRARGANNTESTSILSRRSPNSTDPRDSKLMSHSSNSTLL